MFLGAHETTKERGWSVHRNSGLFTILGMLCFSFVIMFTKGDILNNDAWSPMLSWFDGFEILGGWLMLAGVLGIAGLALERNDGKIYPRIITLISAFLGASWFMTATVGFLHSNADGFDNAGMFMAFPGVILNTNRIWLLGEFPKKGPKNGEVPFPQTPPHHQGHG